MQFKNVKYNKKKVVLINSFEENQKLYTIQKRIKNSCVTKILDCCKLNWLTGRYEIHKIYLNENKIILNIKNSKYKKKSNAMKFKKLNHFSELELRLDIVFNQTHIPENVR